jgi:hypothetical protein
LNRSWPEQRPSSSSRSNACATFPFTPCCRRSPPVQTPPSPSPLERRCCDPVLAGFHPRTCRPLRGHRGGRAITSPKPPPSGDCEVSPEHDGLRRQNNPPTTEHRLSNYLISCEE